MLEIESKEVVEETQKVVIDSYFETINRHDFVATAELFAETGKLLAPFESPILGRDAIAAYLSQEATGMKLIPQQIVIVKETTEDNLSLIKVSGKVKTSPFTVNVGWQFCLDQAPQIIVAKIKLLASPQELLNLQTIAK
jgi:hypothetical protein